MLMRSINSPEQIKKKNKLGVARFYQFRSIKSPTSKTPVGDPIGVTQRNNISSFSPIKPTKVISNNPQIQKTVFNNARRRTRTIFAGFTRTPAQVARKTLLGN